MARPSPRFVAALVGAAVTSWIAAFVLDQLAAHLLALPDGATVTAPEDGRVALGSALGSTHGAGTRAGTGAAGSGPGRETSLKPPRRGDFVDPIVSRSIFDSTKVGSSSTGDPASDGPEAKSDLDALLMATVVASPAEYSSALIARKGGDDAKGYGLGDDLFGEGTIVGVEQRRVVIERSDGSREYIAMDVEAKVQKSTSRTIKGKAAKEDGVEKTGDNKFVVDAELVEDALKNPEKLASQIRVSPHKDTSGTIDGYRLSGIRRNSLFKKLGIKNGDIVHAVNGQPLTSMSSAMNAYDSLQNDKNFSFDVTRRNKRETYEYEIR